MSNLGIGVMLGMLGGGRGGELLQAAIGKTITRVELKDEALHFEFEDGSRIRIFDDGQSCCESRYMRTDDDLSYFAGAKLLGVEIREAAESPETDGEVHEIEFLDVNTDKGAFQMTSHNEHNGYYGGFRIKVASE